MKPARVLLVVAAGYAVVALVTTFVLQTKFLGDETYLVPQAERDVPLQVRGALVYVSALQYWLFKIGLYSAVGIIVTIVFGTALKRQFDK